MLRHTTIIGVALVILGTTLVASGQKATEQFIPIGKSPGLSGEYTKIGTLDEASAQAQSLTMSDASGSYTVRVAETTRIWLDKSGLKSPNEVGTFSDLKPGRMVEVKYKNNDPESELEWIKVQITE